MDIPIGTILAYAGPNVDEETAKQWMLCDGRSLDKTKYKELYKVISQSFGAGYDESGNKIQGDFNIPDLRGRFLRGVSEDLKYDPDFDSREPMRKGGNPGGNVGSIQPGATKLPINPFVTDNPGDHHHKSPTYAGGDGDKEVPNNHSNVDFNQSADTSDDGNHTHKISGGGDAETRPKNIYVNYIIKYK